MSDLVSTIRGVGEAFGSVEDAKKPVLIKSLVQLSSKLADRVGELNDIPTNFSENLLPVMEAQLQAAEKRTEKAADDIMNAAEAMMAALGEIEGAGKEKIQTQINVLFEASSFQDLVAQHLNEVKLRMEALKKDMVALQDVVESLEGGSGGAKKRKQGGALGNPLLNGPATNV